MDQDANPGGVDDLQIAIAHHQAGRLSDAERLYLKILRENPDEPDALNLLSVIVLERGEIARAVELASHALRQDPDFPDALVNLARAQRAAGDFQAAAQNAARAEALEPELGEAPLMHCRALLDLKDHAAAAEAGERAAKLLPARFDVYDYLGQALEALNDWSRAATVYEAAHDLRPERFSMTVRLAIALLMVDEPGTAATLFQEAAERAPNELRPIVGLAVALQRKFDIPGSAAACRRALELAPERADLWLMQVGNLEALGNFEEAAACLNRSLELEPGNIEALGELGKMGLLGSDAARIERLREALNDARVAPAHRLYAGYGLGAMYDKSGAYDEAFACFKLANDLARAGLASAGNVFDLDEMRENVDSRIGGFNRALLVEAGAKGNPSEVPVFIVGMPRSGTTLVEQIVANHPRVYTAHETKDIHDIITRLDDGRKDLHPALWEPVPLRRETMAHINHLQDLGGGAERVIDKLPDNIMHLGHIAIMFPRARVIVCRRDLRDVCLSCYFENFSDPTPWSLDLADCGARAREIERMLAHWREALPLRMLEVQYESLVADLEGQSRRLIDFLGLEWDPACLDYYKADRTVLTLSLRQVRKPIYSSSMGRWRRYRRHLGPLLAELGDLVPDEDGEGASERAATPIGDSDRTA